MQLIRSCATILSLDWESRGKLRCNRIIYTVMITDSFPPCLYFKWMHSHGNSSTCSCKAVNHEAAKGIISVGYGELNGCIDEIAWFAFNVS